MHNVFWEIEFIYDTLRRGGPYALGGCLLVLTLSGCFPPFDKFDKRQTVEVEEKISKDPGYREMDDLCKSVKLAEEIELVGKSRLFNSVGIIYFYRTEVRHSKIENFVLDSMSADGWESVQSTFPHRELFFRKGTTEVTVQFGGIGSDIEIGVTCSKISAPRQV